MECCNEPRCPLPVDRRQVPLQPVMLSYGVRAYGLQSSCRPRKHWCQATPSHLARTFGAADRSVPPPVTPALCPRHRAHRMSGKPRAPGRHRGSARGGSHCRLPRCWLESASAPSEWHATRLAWAHDGCRPGACKQRHPAPCSPHNAVVLLPVNPTIGRHASNTLGMPPVMTGPAPQLTVYDANFVPSV